MDEKRREEAWPDPGLRMKVASAVSMDEERMEELWSRYSTVWRNVLTRVLEWPKERVDQYIQERRGQMEAGLREPLLDVFGFFYDPPTHDLFQAVLGGGLHEQIMQCKSDEANPSLIFQRLVHAMAGSHIDREMERTDFDWNQARARYQNERERIATLLVSLGSGR